MLEQTDLKRNQTYLNVHGFSVQKRSTFFNHKRNVSFLNS